MTCSFSRIIHVLHSEHNILGKFYLESPGLDLNYPFIIAINPKIHSCPFALFF